LCRSGLQCRRRRVVCVEGARKSRGARPVPRTGGELAFVSRFRCAALARVVPAPAYDPKRKRRRVGARAAGSRRRARPPPRVVLGGVPRVVTGITRNS
jgi:hypothetical protein